MTGLDRLRGYARRMDELHVWPGGAKLLEIAEQIERELEDEQCSDVETVRSDAMEAWQWVRERGGLDTLKALRLNHQNLCALVSDIAERLGFDRSCNDHEPEELFDALDRRLMPEGMEWPRYESGEPVPIGGEFMGEDGKTYTAKQIQFIGKCFSLFDFCDRKPQFSGFYGERVERPQVLAADGEPLEVGQTVWDTDAESDTPLTVVEVSSDLIWCEYTWKDGKTYRPCYPPSVLTHTKPDPVDTWRRIEEDARLKPSEYVDMYRVGRIGFESEDMRVDLVRRCKALAERGE